MKEIEKWLERGGRLPSCWCMMYRVRSLNPPRKGVATKIRICNGKMWNLYYADTSYGVKDGDLLFSLAEFILPDELYKSE